MARETRNPNRPRWESWSDLWREDSRPFDSPVPGILPFPHRFEQRGSRFMSPSELPQLLQRHAEVWGTESAQRLRRRWSWLMERNPFREEGELVVPVQVERDEIQAYQVMVPQTFRFSGRPWRAYLVASLTGRGSRPGALIRLWRIMRTWPVMQWGPVAIHTKSAEFSQRFFRYDDYFSCPDETFDPEPFGPNGDRATRPVYYRWSWPSALVRPLRTGPYLPSAAMARAADVALTALDRAFLERGDDPRVIAMDRFPESLDPWLEHAMEGYPVILERSSRYLNWHYVDYDEAVYRRFLFEDASGEPRGYAVVEETQGVRGHPVWEVVDLLVPCGDDAALGAVLRGVLRKARDAGMTAVRAWAPGPASMDATYKRLGFRKRGGDDRSLMLWRAPADVDLTRLADRGTWPFCAGDASPCQL